MPLYVSRWSAVPSFVSEPSVRSRRWAPPTLVVRTAIIITVPLSGVPLCEKGYPRKEVWFFFGKRDEIIRKMYDQVAIMQYVCKKTFPAINVGGLFILTMGGGLLRQSCCEAPVDLEFSAILFLPLPSAGLQE